MTTSTSNSVGALTLSNRWLQLVLTCIAMMSVSSTQYVWTLFARPLDKALGTGLPEIQVTFSLLLVMSTFCSPFLGFMVDRFGARLLFSIGALMVGGSWILTAYATTLWAVYITYGFVGGIGLGIIGVGAVGVLVRWFPDRRGLAVGILQAGFGFGPVFTSFPINNMIITSGYEQTLIVWGIIQAIVGVVVAQYVRVPPAGYLPDGFSEKVALVQLQSRRNYAPKEMLNNPIFWVLFLMMAMMSTSGLMVVSNVGPFAHEYNVAETLVLGMAALPLSLTLSRVTNGITRPFFGWVSDHIGREPTMAIAFSLEGLAMLGLFAVLHHPVMFVVMTGVVFFGWGEIFSLFPSVLTDTFGTKHATTNYGFLYIAQGIGAIFGGPMAALLRQTSGSWTPVFIVVAILDFSTALLAITVLLWLRRRYSTS